MNPHQAKNPWMQDFYMHGLMHRTVPKRSILCDNMIFTAFVWNLRWNYDQITENTSERTLTKCSQSPPRFTFSRFFTSSRVPEIDQKSIKNRSQSLPNIVGNDDPKSSKNIQNGTLGQPKTHLEMPDVACMQHAACSGGVMGALAANFLYISNPLRRQWAPFWANLGADGNRNVM